MIDLRFADNLGEMQALLAAGKGVHLAYLDPPFCTGRDFYYRPRGGEEPELAYSDKWASLDAFVATLRERVALVRELLTPDGCLVVHVDPETSHHVKVMLDGLFGRDCFQNEIVWRYRTWPTPQKRFQWSHDTLLRYVRSAREEPRWNQLFDELAPSAARRGGRKQVKRWQPGNGTRGKSVGYALTDEASPGALMGDVWEIACVNPLARERTGYPTQKPEALLERIVSAMSLPGDVVLDPYVGSGTTLAVCARLGRAGIGIDASPVAIRVARARLGKRPRAHESPAPSVHA
jgi:DNA modification methylase